MKIIPRWARTREGRRLYVAEQIHRLPWTCWSSLVDWACRPTDDPDGPKLPWEQIKPSLYPTARCQQEAARHGQCYCGQIRAYGPIDPLLPGPRLWVEPAHDPWRTGVRPQDADCYGERCLRCTTRRR